MNLIAILLVSLWATAWTLAATRELLRAQELALPPGTGAAPKE